MAWAYCQECRAEFTTPSLRDCLIGHFTCKGCKSEYKIDEITRIHAIDDFIDEHESLKTAHPRVFNK